MPIEAIAIIPARLASERLPNKPLLDLGGAPLIVRVCDNAAAAKIFTRIIVACDAVEVQLAVQNAGYEAILTDPQLASGTDRVAAVAKTLYLAPDAVIINVQGDEPFVSSEALAGLVAAFEDGAQHMRKDSAPTGHAEAQIATVIEKCIDLESLVDPNVVKVALGELGRALYFSRAAIPYDRSSGGAIRSDAHFRHVGLYGFRAGVLAQISALPEHRLEQVERLEQLRWLAHGYTIRCVEAVAGARGIDTPEDLDRARIELSKRLERLR